MKYTIHKEYRIKDNWWVYSIMDKKGSLRSIKAMRSGDGARPDRKKMAKVLWMLRKTGFMATELSGTQKFPPLGYFGQLKEEGLKLYAITYDDIDMLPDSGGNSFDVYGLSTHPSHHSGHFFFRIYDREYYKKVLELLLPLIQESGIICQQKYFIISGDIRNQ